MSTTYPIENIGQSPTRKYGEVIQPGQVVHFDQSAVLTYSLMELARDINTIATKLTSIEGMMVKENDYITHERLNKTDKTVNVSHMQQVFQVETTPWLVVKYRQWKANRDFRRRMKARQSQLKEASNV